MKRLWRLITVAMALFILSGCGGDGIVVDEGGIGRERDVMIAEAAENTRLMDAQK